MTSPTAKTITTPSLPLTVDDRKAPRGQKWDDFPPRAQEWIQRAHAWLWFFIERDNPGASGSLSEVLRRYVADEPALSPSEKGDEA